MLWENLENVITENAVCLRFWELLIVSHEGSGKSVRLLHCTIEVYVKQRETSKQVQKDVNGISYPNDARMNLQLKTNVHN